MIVVCLIVRILLIVICQRVLSDKLSRFASDPPQEEADSTTRDSHGELNGVNICAKTTIV